MSMSENSDNNSPSLPEAALEDGLDRLPLPSLSICFLIVGTHGDINPFLGLADQLVSQGHRVRVATHATHRRLVLTRGHNFYPLGGDPRKLSQWMVETGGTIWGEALNLQTIPEKNVMIREVISSSWPAVTEPSPDDLDQRPFEADAIIANPPGFAHIHVAEALGVPLHIMFPQPWYYGTRSFPHPSLGLSYEGTSEKNYLTYAAFEGVAWSSMEFFMNNWRRNTLDIPVVHFGMGASTLIPDAKIPFSAMWSPSFVPKPDDWPEQVRVVGTFTDAKVKAASKKMDLSPFQDLIDWLDEVDEEDGAMPIFVGFGSMVIKHPQTLADIIMEAAEKAQCRVVVQSSWTKLDVSASDRCAMVGPCPHDWLLPQTCAVVHHGGAGTTAAGLRAGLPTFVCPFFGDQFMWGEMVRRAGVGPPPCPVSKLTSDVLADNFKTLLDPETRANAERMAESMAAEENGIQGGLKHFLDFLPRDSMLCDISILLGEAKVAKYDIWGWGGRYQAIMPDIMSDKYGLKICTDVAAVLWEYRNKPVEYTTLSGLKQLCLNLGSVGLGISYRRHAITTYAVGRVRDVKSGCIAGIFGFARHIGLALIQIVSVPDSWARRGGLVGCLLGFVLFPFFILHHVIRAFIVVVDRWVTGCGNGCYGRTDLQNFDSRRECNVHETGKTIPMEVTEIYSRGIPDRRMEEVFRAGEIARECKIMFNQTKPRFPEDHWHYKVTPASKILNVIDNGGQNFLKLSDKEFEGLQKLLGEREDNPISFTMFLYLLYTAIQNCDGSTIRPVGTSKRERPPRILDMETEWYVNLFKDGGDKLKEGGNKLMEGGDKLMLRKKNGKSEEKDNDGDEEGGAEEATKTERDKCE